ncbi:MAG: hypothetical protein KDB72_12505 [Mycobacterium sp.]|nr:hypothetical protein [Mycobacterium sp.]
MNPNPPMPASRVKVLAVMASAGALVAMGVLTATAHEGGGGTILSEPGTFTAPSTTEMTTGETTRSKTPEASETVSPEVASPPVIASIPPPP